ncbi:MAG: ABC transporter ATP-binding protein [Gaiellaceae bacterium]
MSAAVESSLTTNAETSAPVLEVKGLCKYFHIGSTLSRRRSVLRAVDDVNFALRPGTVTALVGESGSGKSTVARLLVRLYQPTAGQILFRGADAAHIRGRKGLLHYRNQVQMIFQDPFGSLNPVKRIEYHLRRPLLIHGVASHRNVHQKVIELLETVGLIPPEEIAAKYPHQLSGGQQQRVGIARALAVQPAVLLADEPISMLDVSIRIGILNLMLDLKQKEDIAFLYVTHDIASARYLADGILVMYAGQIVEQGPTDEVLHHPMHPYTQLLLSAVPDPEVGLRHKKRLPPREDRQLPLDHPGCRFADRCALAVDSCFTDGPKLLELRPGHFVRCPIVKVETAVEAEPAAVS